MRKTIWGAATLMALLSGSAFAADMPVKARPAPVAVYLWTGCYVGASGGGLWAHKRWDDNDPASRFRGLTRTDHTASGGMAGGQIGCDYQMDRWVVGLEASYHWVDANATSADVQVPFAFRNSTNVSGLGTITGRAGYTLTDQALIYVRGGVAFERDRYTVTSVTANLPLFQGSEDRVGGLIGVGFEYLFTNNLSAFIEYDYIDMGSRDVSLTAIPPAAGFAPYSIRERKDVVKVGLNYRFTFTGQSKESPTLVGQSKVAPKFN